MDVDGLMDRLDAFWLVQRRLAGGALEGHRPGHPDGCDATSHRATADVIAEIEAAKREREQLERVSSDAGHDDAVAWLGSLGRLWRETSDEGCASSRSPRSSGSRSSLAPIGAHTASSAWN